MTKFSLNDFIGYKEDNKKITMITAYDYPMAGFAEAADIDVILVGDSLGMVVLGYDSTTKVTMEDMLHHMKAVRRGSPDTFVICDMPFLSYGHDIKQSVINAGRLISEGSCNAVKLEGGKIMKQTIEAIMSVGIPVVAHIGYTPQSANMFGKKMIQGKSIDKAKSLVEDAMALEEAGALAIVLELIPFELSSYISRKLSIPTIGIGSGLQCDGQVLVINDILSLYDKFSPKHSKKYANLDIAIKKAISEYIKEVKEGVFPKKANSYDMDKNILEGVIAFYDKDTKNDQRS